MRRLNLSNVMFLLTSSTFILKELNMKIALIIAALAVTTGAFAQTSDSFLLQGTVVSTCSVAITAVPAATALDLVGAGHTGTNVASFTSTTNDLDGMQLSINDDNGGLLVNQTDGSYDIAYTVDYSGSSTGNDSAGIAPTVAPANLDAIAAPGDITGDIDINITADATLPDGSYEANLTISCATL